MTATSLTEFYDLLNNADWYYEMSDDQQTYRKGQEAMTQIRQIAASSPAHQKLYDEFIDYIWHNCDKKPVRPFVSGLSDLKAGE